MPVAESFISSSQDCAAPRAWLNGPVAAPGREGGAVRALVLDVNGVALRAEPRSSEMAPAPAADCLHLIEVPTLLIWGDLDFPRLQAHCQRMATQLPKVRCEVQKGTSHLPYLEQPERFNHALLAFCQSLPSCPVY